MISFSTWPARRSRCCWSGRSTKSWTGWTRPTRTGREPPGKHPSRYAHNTWVYILPIMVSLPPHLFKMFSFFNNKYRLWENISFLSLRILIWPFFPPFWIYTVLFFGKNIIHSFIHSYLLLFFFNLRLKWIVFIFLGDRYSRFLEFYGCFLFFVVNTSHFNFFSFILAEASVEGGTSSSSHGQLLPSRRCAPGHTH